MANHHLTRTEELVTIMESAEQHDDRAAVVGAGGRAAPRRVGLRVRAVTRPTEAECQRTIVTAATMLGYRVHHTRPAQSRHGWRTPIMGHAGFPDLVIAGCGRIWFVELKRKPNKVDPAQRQWLEVLDVSGDVQSTVVWVPEEMQQLLNELAAAAAAWRIA